MRYLEAINGILSREAARHPTLVQFGENIAQGSRLCGVARNLTGRVLTVGNCENTHVGVGLGMMMEGGHALLIVKQLDFLLLGLDQLVNTLHLARAQRLERGPGSFTILVIVCDQGWQGPQSSFHDFAGICTLARVDGYYLNGMGDAALTLSKHLVEPGFRLIAVSQRRFNDEILNLPVLHSSEDDAELQYADGPDATIVALGFALPEALEVSARLRSEGKSAALFQINAALPHVWAGVIESAARTRHLIVLDDAKGACSLAHKVVSTVLGVVPGCSISLHTREHPYEFALNEDRFAIGV
jgi:pyruvate/2-oxoglutarate/acetoin dehydrogenase E1 component